jgi:uncharacterized protein YjgD (DUF1641 family)
MAAPIKFKPKSVDPKFELQRRLEAAPIEHAESLLVAYDLLEEAHKQGILDALHGAIGAKDTIVGLLAKYSAEPVSINAIRNGMILTKLLGSLNPEPLSEISKQIAATMESHAQEKQPPSLWALFRRSTNSDSRRGLSLLTSILQAVGRATRT